MKSALFLTAALLAAGAAHAFPPAPHHELYGTARDEQGHPLPDGAVVTLLGNSGAILSGGVSASAGPGMNYSLKVPMDAGTLAQLYQSTALLPAMPFTVKVTLDGSDHVPIEVQGAMMQIGEPGGRTRLDLTLGSDSDGDGLPDAWENKVIAGIDGLDALADVTREGDADGDGVSNYIEYLAGTYAYDRRAVFRLEVVDVKDGRAHLRFLAVKGRRYRLFAGVSGEDFEPVSFTLDPGSDDESPLYRASSIHFQDIYVRAEQPEGRQLYRLHVD